MATYGISKDKPSILREPNRLHKLSDIEASSPKVALQIWIERSPLTDYAGRYLVTSSEAIYAFDVRQELVARAVRVQDWVVR